MSKAYKPREYKTMASAKRAGRRECMKRGIVSYYIYELGTFYLVVGNKESFEFIAWLQENGIPVHKGECQGHFVWDALKKQGSDRKA